MALMTTETNHKESTMYNKLVAKLKKQHAIYAATRKQYPEIARQAKINAKAIEKQIRVATR